MLKNELLACVFDPQKKYYNNIINHPVKYGYRNLKKNKLKEIVNMDIPVSKKKNMINKILYCKENSVNG